MDRINFSKTFETFKRVWTMDVTCWEQESPAIPVEDVANKARGQPVYVVQKLKMIMKILCNRSRLYVMKTMFLSGSKDWLAM